MTTKDWRTDAACLEHVPEFFFPAEHGGSAVAALTVCAGCPVREPCLELGMGTDIGVYGGMTPNDRRRLRRARKAA